MRFVDALVAAVPTRAKHDFVQHAERSTEIFIRHGAVDVVWCWGVDVTEGERTSFPRAVECGADETVVMAWVIWPSADARAQGMARAFGDPNMQPNVNPLPYDGPRAIYGTFEALVETVEAASPSESPASSERGLSASVCGVEKRAAGPRT